MTSSLATSIILIRLTSTSAFNLITLRREIVQTNPLQMSLIIKCSCLAALSMWKKMIKMNILNSFSKEKSPCAFEESFLFASSSSIFVQLSFKQSPEISHAVFLKKSNFFPKIRRKISFNNYVQKVIQVWITFFKEKSFVTVLIKSVKFYK